MHAVQHQLCACLPPVPGKGVVLAEMMLFRKRFAWPAWEATAKLFAVSILKLEKVHAELAADGQEVRRGLALTVP